MLYYLLCSIKSMLFWHHVMVTVNPYLGIAHKTLTQLREICSHPSQQLFSYIMRGLPGLNQYLARVKVSCSRTQCSDAGEVWIRDPSVTSEALYHWATALPNSCALNDLICNILPIVLGQLQCIHIHRVLSIDNESQSGLMLCFQHLWRHLGNVNAWKTMLEPSILKQPEYALQRLAFKILELLT